MISGRLVETNEASYRYDVDQVQYYASLDKDIDHWLKANKDSPVYVLHDSQKPRSLACNSLRLDVERLAWAASAARMVKDEHEIALIRRANEISALAHRRIFENISTLTNETQIEAQFLDECISHDAKHQAYPVIAGSGENIAALHYFSNNASLKGKQLVCLDAGAEWNCYASDVTRTFPLQGVWPSTEAKNIYELVEQIQEECIAAVRVGIGFLDLQNIAQQGVIRGLLKLGVLKGGDMLELFMAGVARVFFPHGLGHHVGLEVHDVEVASPSSREDLTAKVSPLWPTNDRFVPWTTAGPPFEEGSVITVEPGIYFSRFLLDDVKKHPSLAKYIDFGVVDRYLSVGGTRIEDDLLVTKYGCESLTMTPKGEEMLAIIRAGAGKSM